jgi:hypothetical protein
MSDEEFYATRHAVELRKTQRGRRGESVRCLFTGIIFNARDGHSLWVKPNYHGRRQQYLVPSGATYRESDAPYVCFPYGQFENEFLKWMHDPLTAELLSKGTPGRERQRQALAGRLAEIVVLLEKLARQIAADPESETLQRSRVLLEQEKEKKSKDLDALRREETNNHMEALGKIRSLFQMVRDCPPGDLADLRTRLKAAVRRLVREIRVLVDGERGDRWPTVQVFLDNGMCFTQTVEQKPRPTQTYTRSLPDGRKVTFRLRGSWLVKYRTEQLRREQDLRQWRFLDNPPRFGRDGKPAE